jgi:hypothetical protein
MLLGRVPAAEVCIIKAVPLAGLRCVNPRSRRAPMFAVPGSIHGAAQASDIWLRWKLYRQVLKKVVQGAVGPAATAGCFAPCLIPGVTA